MAASEDSSSAPGIYDYDVFLSVNLLGLGLADMLFNRLTATGVRVFRDGDDELLLERDDLPSSVRKAIKRSRISIPVFTFDYAGSKQCLDGVVQMLECRERQGHRIFPIYYAVHPSYVRESSYFFTEHERSGIDPCRIGIWKRALRDVTSLQGWEFDDWSRNEHIERVVSHVCQSLKGELSFTTMDVSGGSSLIKGTYDVFLNYESHRRGLISSLQDTGIDFVDCLYRSLKHAGLLVFRGKDVPVGEEMVDFTLRVIKRSKISIPVFCIGYAPTESCLDELVEMLKCRESQRQRIFPIYFGVDPRNVRDQTGSFTQHESGGIHPGRIGMWKEAIHKVASLKGWELPHWIEQEKINCVVSHVLRSLKEDTSSTTMDMDVFLNCETVDARGIANRLYSKLKDEGVLVFRGEDVPVGEEPDAFFHQKIKRSKISIPVFSKRYGSSVSCLDELVQVVIGRESQGQRIFPIYYRVRPRDISDQKGPFWKPFTTHERGGADPVRIETWKRALCQVASLKGWELHSRIKEKHIKRIVSQVLQKLGEDKSSIAMDVSAGSCGIEGVYDYDVFLNFESNSGKAFADHLYQRLKDAGVPVFRDKDVPVGEETASFVHQVIKRSRISIPLFSSGYASSKQCLDEVVEMLKCRERHGHRTFPLYYRVYQNDVRDQTGPFRESFTEHEESGIDPGRIDTWKQALREVTSLKGWKFDHGFKRYSMIIVNAVLNKLKENRSILVGMQDRVEKLKKVLDVEFLGVLFVGVHRIGGIGKTTLARALFDQLSPHYDGCSFLRDIRETSKHKGLKHLQDQLMRDLTCDNADCETKTAHIFLEKKVLIVLDDVSERGQIKKLVGNANQFVSGSRIIVTTRDINVLAIEHKTLDGHLLKWPEEVKHFEMKEMESAEALQLFCFHAFGEVHPPNDSSRSKDVVSSVGKLPLALEIIGSYLNHKPKNVWEMATEKLKKLPDRGLHKALTISYEALESETREIFLDIACFFADQEKSNPIYMWDACELLPELGIEVLSFLSFVRVLDNNRLWMHDEVRDFGRKTAKDSRLWVNEVFNIARSKKENDRVQGLRLHYDELLQDITFPLKKCLPNLRFIELMGFPLAVKCVLPKLRWFSWQFCPPDVNTSDLYLKILVILDLSNSYINDQFSESGQLEVAKHLKVLDLTNCKSLTRTPIFSTRMILERLILKGCEKLVKIDSSIGNLQQLMYLNLRGCYSVEELPKELGMVTSLTELIVGGNGQSLKLCESLVGLTSLSFLEIDNVKIVDPVHIGNSKRLKCLILSECSGIKEFPELGQFSSLVKLDISGSGITQLPDSIGEMKNLKVINMESSLICELHKSIGNLEKLEELRAKKCRGLNGEIPIEIGALSSLSILDLSFTRISSLPTTLGQLADLQVLNLESCHELEKLPELPKNLISLRIMSKQLHSLPDLSEMNRLRDMQLSCPIDKFHAAWIEKISTLERLELSIAGITDLKFSNSSQLRSLSISCKEIEISSQLPSTLLRLHLAHFKKNTKLPSLCNLKSLTFLEFYDCSLGGDELRNLGAVELKSLEHLSASKCDFDSDNGLLLLQRLRVLSLRECELPKLLDLQTLVNLIKLELIDCRLLTNIRGLEKLESLEEIIIRSCKNLKTFGDLSELKKLNALQIDCCVKLREVKGLERMNSLKHLQISRCKSLESSPHGSKRSSQLLTHLSQKERKKNYMRINLCMLPRMFREMPDS